MWIPLLITDPYICSNISSENLVVLPFYEFIGLQCRRFPWAPKSSISWWLSTFAAMLDEGGERFNFFLPLLLPPHCLFSLTPTPQNTFSLIPNPLPSRIMMVMIMIMNLYSAFFIYICSNALYTYFNLLQRPDHNTGSFVPYSLRIMCGFFNVPCYKTEDTGDGTYGLSSFSEQTRMSNHLQM